MKKSKLLLAALMLLMASGAFAQLRVGVKAGGNLSKITGFPFEGKMKFGFHAGIFLDFALNERLSLQPELLYSAQGLNGSYTDYDGEDNPINVTGSTSLDYINVPVLLKINIAEGLSAEIGPQIGYLVSATAKLESVEGKQVIDMKKEKTCKDFDVTAVAGLSYTFAENFVISARYCFGFTSVQTEDVSEVKAQNRVIQLSIGYKF